MIDDNKKPRQFQNNGNRGGNEYRGRGNRGGNRGDWNQSRDNWDFNKRDNYQDNYRGKNRRGGYQQEGDHGSWRNGPGFQ